MTILKLKSQILSRSIHEDQEAVIALWMKTFLHNTDDTAIKISKLLFSSVYLGDFKTRSALAGQREHASPNQHLTCIDYLSHGSRIIFDYESLSPENRIEFLQFFPDPSEESKVFSRSSTHAIVRKNSVIIEKKGFHLGVQSFALYYVARYYDFGVNIAMGGTDQVNFAGKKILPNGNNGHIYFHRYNDQCLVMCGLEQNAPQSTLESIQSAYDTLQSMIQSQAVTEAPSDAVDVQIGTDQFGQKHSLTGASDTYTAAGSLYFSDPVYQVKLLLEKGCFAPDKYGAMIVTLTNENWSMIKDSIKSLNQMISDKDEVALVERLHELPKSASHQEQAIPSYIAFTFESYLQRIYEELIYPSELSQAEKEELYLLQQKFLDSINQIKQDQFNQYLLFLSLCQSILNQSNLPKAYQESIQRIKDLFRLQFKKCPEPFINSLQIQSKQIHERLKRLYDELSVSRERFESTMNPSDESQSLSLSRWKDLEKKLSDVIKGNPVTAETFDHPKDDPEYLIQLKELLDRTELLMNELPKQNLDSSISEPAMPQVSAIQPSSSSFFQSSKKDDDSIEPSNDLTQSQKDVVYSPIPVSIIA